MCFTYYLTFILVRRQILLVVTRERVRMRFFVNKNMYGYKDIYGVCTQSDLYFHQQ